MSSYLKRDVIKKMIKSGKWEVEYGDADGKSGSALTMVSTAGKKKTRRNVMIEQLIDKYLGEASINMKTEIKKAFMRLDSFTSKPNYEKHINLRTKKMTKPHKLVAWAMALEDWNYHSLVDYVIDRYRELTGGNMMQDPMWRKGLSAFM